jgi:hypothetical protein
MYVTKKDMGKKRRTKKDKQKAKHTFKMSWEKGVSRRKKTKSVKGQSPNSHKSKSSGTPDPKNAKSRAKDEFSESIKKDIIRSLALAAVILSLEVMLYFIWPS